jgi:hypothetical protein
MKTNWSAGCSAPCDWDTDVSRLAGGQADREEGLIILFCRNFNGAPIGETWKEGNFKAWRFGDKEVCKIKDEKREVYVTLLMHEAHQNDTSEFSSVSRENTSEKLKKILSASTCLPITTERILMKCDNVGFQWNMSTNSSFG